MLIRLTKSGEAMFQKSFSHLHCEHQKYFNDRFTQEEQRQLQQLLNRL